MARCRSSVPELPERAKAERRVPERGAAANYGLARMGVNLAGGFPKKSIDTGWEQAVGTRGKAC